MIVHSIKNERSKRQILAALILQLVRIMIIVCPRLVNRYVSNRWFRWCTGKGSYKS